MTEYRGIFVTVFVLPLSLLYDVLFSIRAWLVMQLFSAPKLHEKRVQDVQEQITAWHKKQDGTRLCTARGGWQSVSPGYRKYKSKSTQIRVNLYDVLEVDERNMTVRCEPMVNMGQLSHYLIPRGYTIPVLPEMDDLTVGGLYVGVGIETSSHKYGLFNDNVVEAEVVLADGSLVRCSRTENRELFDALPWSYGTLGFLVSCTIRIIPAKPFVRIEYIPCFSREQGVGDLPPPRRDGETRPTLSRRWPTRARKWSSCPRTLPTPPRCSGRSATALASGSNRAFTKSCRPTSRAREASARAAGSPRPWSTFPCGTISTGTPRPCFG